MKSINDAIKFAKVEEAIKVDYDEGKIPRGVGYWRHEHAKVLIKNDCDTLVFLDDDIQIGETYIVAACSLLEDSRIPMASGITEEYQTRMRLPTISNRSPIPTPKDNFVVRADDLKKVGGIDKRLHHYEGYELLARLRIIHNMYPLITSIGMRVIKKHWRMPGGLNNGDRDEKKLECGLILLRQFPGGMSLVSSGERENSWRLKPVFPKLKELPLKHQWNDVA